MADNSLSFEEAQDQKPIVNNWNSNEFGLQPRNLIEKITRDFLKVFGYNFAWDENSNIWRMNRADIAGNLRVTNGTQSSLSPVSSAVDVATTLTPVLAKNTNRRYVVIYNNSATTNVPAQSVTVRYPNPISDAGILLPPGFFLIEDSWQGTIDAITNLGSGSQRVTVAEYS